MRITKYIVSVLVLVLLASCASIKVERLTSESKINKSGIIYTLPKTKLNINVDVVKTTCYKGPFSEYAKEYLGIENVIENNSTEYKLSQIDVVSTIENDNDYTYLLTNYNKSIKTFSYFEGTQVISTINTTNIETEVGFEEKDFTNETSFVPFKDRTVKPLVIEKSDTVWKTILVDSVYKRIPKVNTAIAPRTVKEQAYMASRFILKIRKRRLRVLTGMDKNYPKGNTLKKIISELDKLENEYLNLFIGVKTNDTAKYTYSYVPDTNLTGADLFNFDTKRGISNNSKYTVSINFTDDNKSEFYDRLNKTKAKKSEFVYKTAKFVKTNILFDSKPYKTVSVPIYQVGIVNYIPSKFTENKIVFDRKTGMFSVND